MSLPRVAGAVLAGALLLAGCGSAADHGTDDTSTGTPAAGAPSTEAPAADPGPAPRIDVVADLAPADAGTVAASVNQFGFDLLGQLSDGTQNTVTSPVSVASLLAMVLAGAGGDTASAMAGTLHLDDPRDVRVGALLDQLADTTDVTLAPANALWTQQGVPFEADYLSFVRDSFGATIDEADLGSQDTADDIDAWVRDATEDRIDGIAADLGLPDPEAALVLVNAVHFLGTWTTQFDPADTQTQAFTLPDASTADVPLMFLREQTLPFVQRDGYSMLRLPYGADGRYGMEILLPDDPAGLPRLLSSLDAAEWSAAVGALAPLELQTVAVPKFELEWDADLGDALTALGMGPAFQNADFRPMSAYPQALDTVVHKTYIRVDEAGTEAAAVTGGVTRSSAGQSFRADRPFAFTISDSQTGAIVFLGAVTDPRG
ncbi:serpin family protein [Jiangella sp. DSM 45060]|uniref:serpin family protein n=1 Tax=Jiangella sp. DSM 45060 TaxID=1798224 RepID=UPI00087A4945|nr:serpin family protein [Jiangella sp. DSM 45060]SDT29299.1 serpin B [Jiangella sp. DSM 45060]